MMRMYGEYDEDLMKQDIYHDIIVISWEFYFFFKSEEFNNAIFHVILGFIDFVLYQKNILINDYYAGEHTSMLT